MSTTKGRSSRRQPPPPASPGAGLLTVAQIDELLELQQTLAAALEQATEALAEQNQKLIAAGELLLLAEGKLQRFARHLLGVTPEASAEDLRPAYRARARTLHPDAGGDAEAFSLLGLALELLEAGLTTDSVEAGS